MLEKTGTWNDILKEKGWLDLILGGIMMIIISDIFKNSSTI